MTATQQNSETDKTSTASGPENTDKIDNFFKCDLCIASFTYAHEFDEHRKQIHKNTASGPEAADRIEDFFKCELCTASFTHAHEFDEHRKQAHKITTAISQNWEMIGDEETDGWVFVVKKSK